MWLRMSEQLQPRLVQQKREPLNFATRTFGMCASLLKYWKLFWTVVAPIVSLPKPNEKRGCQ